MIWRWLLALLVVVVVALQAAGLQQQQWWQLLQANQWALGTLAELLMRAQQLASRVQHPCLTVAEVHVSCSAPLAASLLAQRTGVH